MRACCSEACIASTAPRPLGSGCVTWNASLVRPQPRTCVNPRLLGTRTAPPARHGALSCASAHLCIDARSALHGSAHLLKQQDASAFADDKTVPVSTAVEAEHATTKSQGKGSPPLSYLTWKRQTAYSQFVAAPNGKWRALSCAKTPRWKQGPRTTPSRLQQRAACTSAACWTAGD